MIPLDSWKRWRQPGGYSNPSPQLVYGGNMNSSQPSSRYLEDASYFRIQNITLGYNFPKVFAGLNVYFRFDNPVVFTNTAVLILI